MDLYSVVVILAEFAVAILLPVAIISLSARAIREIWRK